MRAQLIVLIALYTCLQVVHCSSITNVLQRRLLKKKVPPSQLKGSSLESSSGAISISELALNSQNANQVNSTTASNAEAPTTAPTTTTSTTTNADPNADLDDLLPPPSSNNPQDNSTKTPNKDNGPGGQGGDKNANKGNSSLGDNQTTGGSFERVNIELSVLWYSVFMVYVSFVKLIYHNVAIIKRNLTEPGILMIFGIIWELISRQINSTLDVSPRFNSRIFFYLFLPSTVLESASILSNKWLLLNLLPILIHSIVGTLLYGSAIAFTVFTMSRQGLFNIGGDSASSSAALYAATSHHLDLTNSTVSEMMISSFGRQEDQVDESSFLYEKSYVINSPMLEVGNLTLADCLIFGSIMSSLDSTTMLGAFSMFQVNEKLYYLVLGESLMNNAVVLIVFNLLLDFLNASRLTVVKIYIAIIQFFVTLIGSMFVGLILASVALLAVRLIKRFQVPSALTSYQNQCLAMIETLLVLKLAYLTYTLGSLAGMSSIVSLATFGVLQHQYISLNLNLRSQLTFRQVVLATKTMGFSLVYPLLGMLLVDVAYASQQVHLQQVHHSQSSAMSGRQSPTAQSIGTLAATKLTSLANQASLSWNFKFLSLVTVISLAYRFGIVICLSFLCNLISNRKVKVKLREQLLMAYGGLKGPLAVALVHRLIEHEDHRDRVMRNKHLFMYTILFITLLSVILKGAFIRPLVEKMQISLDHPKLAASQKFVLFNAINTKVVECATQAVNNLMGRSKSSYDRLFEFNECRLKPWLAREGSQTNWLSNLYDNLLLDKTLDSNCFYQSNAEPIAGSFWHSGHSPNHHHGLNHSAGRGGGGGGGARMWRRRPSSVRLDTINEHGGGFIDDDELNAMNSHLELTTRRKSKHETGRRHQSITGLKELVMSDLRSDGDQPEPRRTSSQRQSFENGYGSIAVSVPDMLSSSSVEARENPSGARRRPKRRSQSGSDKEGYISRLEKHLESSRGKRDGTATLRQGVSRATPRQEDRQLRRHHHHSKARHHHYQRRKFSSKVVPAQGVTSSSE